VTATGFLLEVPAQWLARNPWTAAALRDEAAIWKRIGRDYVVESKPRRKIA